MTTRIQTAHRIRRARNEEALQVQGLLPLGLVGAAHDEEGEAMVFIAEEQGQQVALCSVCVIDSQVVYLRDLWVAPRYRSRGILKHLLRRVMQQLKALGYREIAVRTSTEEPSLLRMFASLGLEVYAIESEVPKRVRRWRGKLAAVA